MLGGAVGGLASDGVPMHARPLAAYILAGMGGVFAGVFRTPMTAVFMAFELSGTHVIIVPAMITATLGFLVARMFQRAALLTIVSEDEGAVLPSAQLQREEEPLRVEHAMGRDVPELFPLSSVADARKALDRTGAPVALGTDSTDGLGGPGRALASSRRLAWQHDASRAPRLDRSARRASGRAARHHRCDCSHAIRSSRSSAGSNSQQLLGAVTLADVHRAYGLKRGTLSVRRSKGPRIQGPRARRSKGPRSECPRVPVSARSNV